MRNEFREIEKTLQLINEQRKAAEEVKIYRKHGNSRCFEGLSCKEIGTKYYISKVFSDLIRNPWNQQYYDWVEASKVVMKYLSEQDADKWKDKLIELLGGDTRIEKTGYV